MGMAPQGSRTVTECDCDAAGFAAPGSRHIHSCKACMDVRPGFLPKTLAHITMTGPSCSRRSQGRCGKTHFAPPRPARRRRGQARPCCADVDRVCDRCRAYISRRHASTSCAAGRCEDQGLLLKVRPAREAACTCRASMPALLRSAGWALLRQGLLQLRRRTLSPAGERGRVFMQCATQAYPMQRIIGGVTADLPRGLQVAHMLCFLRCLAAHPSGSRSRSLKGTITLLTVHPKPLQSHA